MVDGEWRQIKRQREILSTQTLKTSSRSLPRAKKAKGSKVSEIIRTGKYISIVRLPKFNNIELNEELRATIEKELYQGWIDEKPNM